MTAPNARRLAAVVLALFASSTCSAFADEPPGATAQRRKSKRLDFAKQIQPILRVKCYECHGEDNQEAGLRLDFKKVALTGGDNGPAIVAGKSDESPLFQAVLGKDHDKKMPPVDEGEPLTPEEVALFKTWIDQGANWPNGIDGAAGERQLGADHWSFRRLVRPESPNSTDPWIRNEVDVFLLRRLKEAGIEPAPEAERHVLIRRLYLDLIGLPPTPDELVGWLQLGGQGPVPPNGEPAGERDENAIDSANDWYGPLVDHLLESSHFGERWGRHWLDLARYADSDGYEKDLPRQHAWRWRDWVINAINGDMPFDEFTVEQLAGDLLPGATIDQQIATGFHRNTLTNREGGVDQEEYRIKAVKDRVYTTGTVWLGLTAQCAECHSHKFDPFSQQEYYELAAFFNNADEADIAAPLPGETEAFRQAKAQFDKRHSELQQALAAAGNSLLQRQTMWEKELAAAETTAREGLPKHILATLDVPAVQRTAAQCGKLTKFYRNIDAAFIKLNKDVDDHARSEPKPPESKSQAFAERPKPRANCVHQRGDFRRPGRSVQPGTLGILHPFQPRGERPDRLDFARWLVDPENPLTPRVAVNRIWQHLFGRGIVETTWDFGTQAAPPTHPELIDWLAGEYIQQGWSRKAMIRLIVHSATYRQSSSARPALEDRDPKNDLIARQNRFRLDAEIVRDLCLAASGLLHPKVGGPSVYPALPADVVALGYAGSMKWSESEAPDRYRRGMYIFFQRSVPYPMLTTFDAPESTVVSTRRDRSNTPLQSLTLLNDPVFVECSQALCRRIMQAKLDTAEKKIRFAFKLCLARNPNPFEIDRLRILHAQLLKLYEADLAAAARMAGEAQGGRVVGRTDDFGWNIVEDPIHINDFHATLLHLFGFDHKELSVRFAGLDVRLTNVAGNVVEKAIA